MWGSLYLTRSLTHPVTDRHIVILIINLDLIHRGDRVWPWISKERLADSVATSSKSEDVKNKVGATYFLASFDS